MLNDSSGTSRKTIIYKYLNNNKPAKFWLESFEKNVDL